MEVNVENEAVIMKWMLETLWRGHTNGQQLKWNKISFNWDSIAPFENVMWMPIFLLKRSVEFEVIGYFQI